MTIYEVKTHGGQIVDDQEPKAIEVPKQLETLVDKAMRENGFFWMSGANYYPTEKRAKSAIWWALSN